MLDESPDRRQKKILNIMIGELNPENPTRPFILCSLELDTADSNYVSIEVNSKMQKLLQTSQESLNFKLLLTDKARYCLSAVEKLKSSYPSMKHVTCVCHGFHNFAETVRNNCLGISKFISIFKKLLKYNKKIPAFINDKQI